MNIIKIKGTSWLAYEDGKGILIDTGMSYCSKAILNKITSLKLSIPVIFMTHTHVDHAGSLLEVQKASIADIVVSSKEADNIRSGQGPSAVGFTFIGKIAGKLLNAHDKGGRKQFDPVTGNISEIKGAQPLGYGFNAEVIPLGAHTEGSIGLKIGDYFFAGDTVFHINRISVPILAYKPDEIKTAWETILNSGAKYVCPGHGKMFGIDKLERLYKKKFKTKRTV
jgi:glyoxylase-like metal-dependent hydrolase (beta-lactamase superfamily II)